VLFGKPKLNHWTILCSLGSLSSIAGHLPGDLTQRRMASFGMLQYLTLLRTYVSKELSASIIRVTRIGELGTTLAVTNNSLQPASVARYGCS
jgi:hypothetical protein